MIRKADHVVDYRSCWGGLFIITLSFGIYGGIEFVNINIDEVWVVYWYLRSNWNEIGVIKLYLTGVKISLWLH